MMRTLRRILAIARKELLVLMGTRQSRFMVLIPPVIQIFIFAWAATMEVKNVDVVEKETSIMQLLPCRFLNLRSQASRRRSWKSFWS